MHLVYLSNTLIGIDRILSVLMEIKKLRPELCPMIVFLNEKHRNDVKMNYNLWEGIESIGAHIYVMKGRNRFITLMRLIRFIAMLSFSYNIIIKDGDVLPLHRITMKILKKISKVVEIKVYLGVQFPERIKNMYIYRTLDRERGGLSIESQFKGEYDYFISSLTKDEWKKSCNEELPKEKMVKVGYIYKLPEWEKFRKKAVKKNEAIKDNHFFYILHTAYQRRHNFKEPDLIELMEESINILKKYNSRIRTIFKPHPVTDIKKVKELLNKVNYSNYVIDYGHPVILSSKAKFVFANTFSSIMPMAYYLGKPIVEYSQYDPELFTRLGKQSLGGKFCDFFIQRDKKKLEEVLDKLINDEVKIGRDPNFMRSNFQDTPREFYEFWHKLLNRR